MIRDPSDGSIKPPPKKIPYQSGVANEEIESERERQRLERDREWLQDWKSKQQ